MEERPRQQYVQLSQGTRGGARWRIMRPEGLSADEYERRLRAAVRRALSQRPPASAR